MGDENNANIHTEDTHLSSDEHNQEIQHRKLSTGNNDESFQNGDHYNDSSNNQFNESLENHQNGTDFIEEQTSSYNGSNNIFNDQLFQNSFEPSNVFDNQDDSNLFFGDQDRSNIDSTFHLPTHPHEDKPEEFKAQRELDEDEIPPAEIPVDVTPISNESHHSSPEIETSITDDRPLTDLETPYEHHHHENDTTDTTDTTDEQNLNNSLTENEYVPEINNSSLPDIITETFEQKHDDYIPQPIELEKPTFEEISAKTEVHFTNEDLPPLPPTSIALEQSNDLNKIDEQPLLSSSSSITQSILSEPDDILGNKTLLKQIITEGIPGTRPTRSTLATVSYTLSLIDNLTSDVRIIEKVSNERFFISECDTIPAIDISIQFMNRGERALIDSDIRHGYGDSGCEEKQIPSINSTNKSYRMKIDLEFHDWISPPDVQKLSIDERLFWGDKKRHMGNFYYRRQDYSTSLQCYRGALRFLDTETNPILISFDESQRSILNDRYIQVQNNVAQVNLLLNKYDACLNAVENVLKYDSKNVKALFRQGKALFELGKYDQALQPFKLFSQIQRGNSAAGSDAEKVTEMMTICENKLANYQKNEKEIYRRMFQPPPPPATTTTLNQQRQTKTNKQDDNSSSNLWLYIGLGSAALAAVGFITFMKYRKTS